MRDPLPSANRLPVQSRRVALRSQRPDLSIVIPAYQEASLIAASLARLAGYLAAHAELGRVEVIVVVADSPDGTARLARQCAPLLPHLTVLPAGPRAGKGRDVRLGMLAATGDYRLFMDADLATPLHHLESVHRLMTRDAASVIAVRDLSTCHADRKRRLITRWGNLLARLVLLPGVTDTQCGFKAFRADVCDAVFGQATIDGWGFDLELLALTRRLGHDVVTVKVDDWSDPKAAAQGLAEDAPVVAAIRVLRDLLRVRVNLWRGRYEVASSRPVAAENVYAVVTS
jgi:glycosyltransferase involved in cell wall biosynthesis